MSVALIEKPLKDKRETNPEGFSTSHAIRFLLAPSFILLGKTEALKGIYVVHLRVHSQCGAGTSADGLAVPSVRSRVCRLDIVHMSYQPGLTFLLLC